MPQSRISEAAARLDVSDDTVRRHIDQHELVAAGRPPYRRTSAATDPARIDAEHRWTRR